jgi:hypothetical protein
MLGGHVRRVGMMIQMHRVLVRCPFGVLMRHDRPHGQEFVVETRCWSGSKRECCARRQDAEQVD